MRAVVLGALPDSLVTFRREVLVDLVGRGIETIAMSAAPSPSVLSELRDMGVSHCSYSVERRGMNPIRELLSLIGLIRKIRALRADAMLAYTIKPVLYGGLASRLAPGLRFCALIEGLGYVFHSGGSVRRRVMRHAVEIAYRLSLRKAQFVIFLNRDNREYFVERGIVAPEQAIEISGIGVNLREFSMQPMPNDGPMRFVMIARLLREKGVREFCLAASRVKGQRNDVEFFLVGPEEHGVDGVLPNEVLRWSNGAVQYLGEIQDVRPILGMSHVLVLPSYHEGRPRTVQEALAVGRPVITTDAPGCRDSIVDGEVGWVIKAASHEALSERILYLLNSPDEVYGKAEACRSYAERYYDAEAISRFLVDKLLSIDFAPDTSAGIGNLSS